MKYKNMIEADEKKYPRVRRVYTAFHAFYDRDFAFPGEKHNFWEVVYIRGGGAVITADSMVYSLGKGEVIFHKPMEFHKIASNSNEMLEVIIFSFAADGDLDYFKNGIFKISPRGGEIAEKIPPLAEKAAKNPTAAQLLINIIERFLITLRPEERLSNVPGDSPGAREFREIVNTMERHIGERLTIDELASLCRLSGANMKKIFYRYTGTGVIKYFNAMKIERAAQLLEQGKSIVEISDGLGFDNQNYFSTVFKREMGICPSAYRRKNEF